MTEKQVQGCKTCKFCRGAPDQEGTLVLYCAIKAPVAQVVPTQRGLQTLAYQPTIPPSQWCGEWQPEFLG